MVHNVATACSFLSLNRSNRSSVLKDKKNFTMRMISINNFILTIYSNSRYSLLFT